MKQFFLLLSAIFFLTSPLFGQTLQGFISYQSSGGRPAIGVKVTAQGANPQYTDDNGMFELIFSNNSAGDRIRLSIGGTDGEGKKIEVVNNRVLEVLNLPSNRNIDPIEIIVVYPNRRDEALRRYYGILEESVNNNYDTRYDKIIKLLQKKNIDETTVTTLTKQLEEVRLERDEALSKIEEQSDYIASINRDHSLAIVNEALQVLDNTNDIQAAISLLDTKELQKIYKNVKLKKSTYNIEISQILEAYQLRIELLISSFRYREAVETFQDAIIIIEKNQLISLETASLFCKYGDLLDAYGDKKTAYLYTNKGVNILRALAKENIFDLEEYPCFVTLAGLEYNLGMGDGSFDFVKAFSFLIDTLSQDPVFIEYIQNEYDNERISSSDFTDSLFIYMGFFTNLYALTDACANEFNNEVDELSDCLRATDRFFQELENFTKKLNLDEEPCWYTIFYRIKAEVYGYKNSKTYSNILEQEIENHSKRDSRHDPDCQLDMAKNLYIPLLGQKNDEGLDFFDNLYFSKTLQALVNSPDSLFEKVVALYQELSYLVTEKDEKYVPLGEYFLRQAINILERNLHSNDPKLIAVYQHMGDFIEDWCVEDEDCLQATEWYKKALRIQENTLSPNHEDLAHTYHTIAEVYNSLSDSNYFKALEYYERCNSTLEKVSDQNDWWIKNNYKEIAEIYFLKHNYEKALQYFKFSLTNNQDTFLECNKNLKRDLEKLVQGFVWQSDEEEKLFGWSHQDTLDAIKYTDALIENYQSYDSCLLPQKETSNHYSFFLLKAIKFIGNIYLEIGDYSKARKTFLQYEYFNGRDDSQVFDERTAIGNWVKYYDKQGKKEKAFQVLKNGWVDEGTQYSYLIVEDDIKNL